MSHLAHTQEMVGVVLAASGSTNINTYILVVTLQFFHEVFYKFIDSQVYSSH